MKNVPPGMRRGPITSLYLAAAQLAVSSVAANKPTRTHVARRHGLDISERPVRVPAIPI